MGASPVHRYRINGFDQEPRPRSQIPGAERPIRGEASTAKARICNECIELCDEIISEELDRRAGHTAGTLLGEQHVDMHVMQRILGHAQVTTTRIYTEPPTR